jgi:hypothetical protein
MSSSAISSHKCLQSVEAFSAGAQHALLSHDQRHLEGVRVLTEQGPSLTSAADLAHPQAAFQTTLNRKPREPSVMKMRSRERIRAPVRGIEKNGSVIATHRTD